MARFKLLRYRRPSLKTALGFTRAKRRFKTQTGYYAATRWMRAHQPAAAGAAPRRLLLRPDEVPALPLRQALEHPPLHMGSAEIARRVERGELDVAHVLGQRHGAIARVTRQ